MNAPGGEHHDLGARCPSGPPPATGPSHPRTLRPRPAPRRLPGRRHAQSARPASPSGTARHGAQPCHPPRAGRTRPPRRGRGSSPRIDRASALSATLRPAGHRTRRSERILPKAGRVAPAAGARLPAGKARAVGPLAAGRGQSLRERHGARHPCPGHGAPPRGGPMRRAPARSRTSPSASRRPRPGLGRGPFRHQESAVRCTAPEPVLERNRIARLPSPRP